MTREEKFAFLLLTLRKGGRRERKGKCLSFLAPEISMGERGEKKGEKEQSHGSPGKKEEEMEIRALPKIVREAEVR